MRTALFPGSFDPFTLGHMDILRSALTMFDKVIVAVGYNSAKSGFFHPDLRVKIIEDAVAGMEGVEVCSAACGPPRTSRWKASSPRPTARWPRKS